MDNPFAALRPADPGQSFNNAFSQSRQMMRQEAEDRRQQNAREAAGVVGNALAGYAPAGGQPNALLGPMAQEAAPTPQAPSPVSDAWRTLAQSDPQLFSQLRQLDNNQRKFVAERMQRNLELGGRAMGSILAVPEGERGAVWTEEVRPYLTANGMEGLPEQWDENFARAQLRLSATAAQALGVDISQHRLEWDIADDKADNARADRNTDSLVHYRAGQLANTRRGQDMADERGRRGQDISSRDRRRGQSLSAGKKAVKVKSLEQARALPAGTVFETPDGQLKVR